MCLRPKKAVNGYLNFLPPMALGLRDGGLRLVGVALHVPDVLGGLVGPLELTGELVVGLPAKLKSEPAKLRVSAELSLNRK